MMKYDPVAELHKYGKRGVELLRLASPKDTGVLASSWSYKVTKKGDGSWELSWHSSDTTWYGYPIALLVQQGHVSKGGGWVPGKDYINSSLTPMTKELTLRLWREIINK